MEPQARIENLRPAQEYTRANRALRNHSLDHPFLHNKLPNPEGRRWQCKDGTGPGWWPAASVTGGRIAAARGNETEDGTKGNRATVEANDG